MNTELSTLFVVDPNPAACAWVKALAESSEMRCQTFASAEDFLGRYQPAWRGCVLAEFRLPGMPALDLQQRLAAMGSLLPVILAGETADITGVVQAMRHGAVTVLEKPYQAEPLGEAVRKAMALDLERHTLSARQSETRERLARLSQRERVALELIVAGRPNKFIARQLNTSQRTVDRIRAAVFDKLNVETAVDLTRRVAELGPAADCPVPALLAGTQDAAGDDGDGHAHPWPDPRDWDWIACELHDGVAQHWNAAIMQWQAFQRERSVDPARAEEAAQAVYDLMQQGLAETRELIQGLQSKVPGHRGLLAAMERLLDEFRSPTGPAIEFRHAVRFQRLAPMLERALYRIFQEAISNACHHSHSARIAVELVQSNGWIRLTIRDWGIGFQPNAIEPECFGLRAMRMRAEMLGGRLEIDTSTNFGTQVHVNLPLIPAAEAHSGQGAA